MTKPEIKNLLLQCLQRQTIPADLTSCQLCQLDHAYAKMAHNIMNQLDKCIRKEPSRLLELLGAQAEEMLDQPENAKFRVAHALLVAGPFILDRFQVDPPGVLSEICKLKPHAPPKSGVYMDPAKDDMPSWLDMCRESFFAATPEMQKERYDLLHCYRMESRLMALYDKERDMM